MKQLISRKGLILTAVALIFLFSVSACGRAPKPENSSDLQDNADQPLVTIAEVQPGVLYEDDMVKISVDGMEMVNGYPEILFTFENKGDLNLRFSDDDVIVNGIILPTGIDAFPGPYSTEQARMIFNEYAELDKAKITHISSIEIDMTLVNDITWEELYSFPRMTVQMKDAAGAPVQADGKLLVDNEETRITLIEAAQLEETIECYLLVENKGPEEFIILTTGFVINGLKWRTALITRTFPPEARLL